MPFTDDGREYTLSAPTPDDLFFGEARRKAIEASPGRVDAAIGRIITLATAMAGSSLLLLKDEMCTGWGRFGAVSLFVVAMFLSAWGSIPSGKLISDDTDGMIGAMCDAAATKKRWLFAAYAAMLAGFVLALAGSIAKAW